MEMWMLISLCFKVCACDVLFPTALGEKWKPQSQFSDRTLKVRKTLAWEWVLNL